MFFKDQREEEYLLTAVIRRNRDCLVLFLQVIGSQLPVSIEDMICVLPLVCQHRGFTPSSQNISDGVVEMGSRVFEERILEKVSPASDG